ncbi:hypothetical protein BE21_50050 [Sorangium cellulosum]|uniref:Uncharacterized protein n=1 Tax=Sorangium cellulosum TaxID=56 RepID=A0A150TGI4_SORCE|nr:hypothetical protein BE21_50050 [Sorangium cellulosum]
MTTRHELEGTLARWFALDADSQLGVFTGAYAAWPAAVFEDYVAVRAADEFLDSAPVVTEGMLSAAYRASKADPTFPLREASRGLYSFDADLGYGGSTIYFLGASPAQPLVAHSAPELLLRAARLVRFTSLRFANVTQLDLAHLVPFVIGDG